MPSFKPTQAIIENCELKEFIDPKFIEALNAVFPQFHISIIEIKINASSDDSEHTGFENAIFAYSSHTAAEEKKVLFDSSNYVVYQKLALVIDSYLSKNGDK